MNHNIQDVRLGLLLVILTLVFGIGMGIAFGVAEDSIKSDIAVRIKAHPDVHDITSNSKIWRYAQRAHFHATGVAAFSIGLITLILFSSLRARLKSITALLVGLGGLYPLSWLSMYLLAPTIGRSAAHSHILTELLTYFGVGSLLLGISILSASLFVNAFND